MQIAPFLLERYFARHEFTTPHHLSCSDCEALTLAELLEGADDECRSLWENLRLSYTDSAGHPLLRAEIARLHQSLRADELLVVTPEEGIFIAMNVLLRRGDHVVCTEPGYQSLHQIARSLGCQLSSWLPREEETGWRFDLEDLEALLRPDTRAVVLNFPHNPTGALLEREEFETVVELCAAGGARLFSDEMYRLLEHDPADRLPSAVDRSETAIALSGMSKSFGLPGLRIGWLACRDGELLARMASYRDYTTICSSAPSELLALMGLRDRARITEGNRRLVTANLRHLDAFMQAHDELFEARPPRAGSTCFPRFHGGEGARAWCESLLEPAGLLVLPAWVFGYGDEHVRFGLGRSDLPENLERLARHLG